MADVARTHEWAMDGGDYAEPTCRGCGRYEDECICPTALAGTDEGRDLGPTRRDSDA